jgi:AcrR family transcriptional regulator
MRQGEREDREQSLIEAAVTVFRTEGYAGASVRAITELAGCGTGTFYLYFPSKDDCFMAIIDRLYQRVLDRVAGRRALAVSTPVKLWASIGAVLEVFSAEHALAHVVLVQGPGIGPPFRDRLERIRQTFSELIAEDLVESGLDPWVAACGARALLGALGEVLIWQVDADASGGRLTRAGEEVRRRFFMGYGLPPVDDGREMMT